MRTADLDLASWPPVVEVLRYYGAQPPPARHGWTAMRCCFHDDNHASAAYNVALNGFACMACDAKGSGLTLISQQEACSVAEAINFARDRIGIRDSSLSEDAETRGRLSYRAGDRSRDGQALPTRLRPNTLFGDA